MAQQHTLKGHGPLMRAWISKHQLITFFVISYLIMFGILFGFALLQPDQPLPSWSLVWFLAVFSPTFSALIVSSVIGGVNEVKRLLSGFTRWRVGWGWYFAAAFLLLGPFVIGLVYISLGNPAVWLKPGWTIPLLLTQALYQLLSGPLSEEAGWRGFALPRLESKYNALASSLILGVIWTFWHLPLFFITGQTQVGIPLPIYLFLVITITIYLTWLYNNTRGSLIITVLAHYCFNLTGLFITGAVSLMPAMIFYMTAGPLLFLVVVGIVIYFKPKYLSRKPLAELPFQKENNEPTSHFPDGAET